ncbi:DNA repair protein RecO [Fuscibacter oryzae]|uniref:DNA repair protein RecO n=1 Tax=Fuscibacter oryzae TaxID=2803939 RepID=A0A8J7SUT0_9RHOB|nr:DNA repair protein RecO [Fuscibacter oryzae]MBL4927084.1 DNA repair protein RecO [Fuscibacter oryzae]
MEWRDEGFLISARPHGEAAAIIEVFTPHHGRHLGVVPGGLSRRMAPVLQPGNQLALDWHARLGDHLGQFRAEPQRARSAILSDRPALTALNAICSLLHIALPEREPHPALYASTTALADALLAKGWQPAYLRWELHLLAELGFALDLSSCAVTGDTTGLAYVSPRTGRAVSEAGAGDWASRLLPLPPVLLGQTLSPQDHAPAMALTGFFLERALEPVLAGAPLPAARQRLADLLARP